MKCISRSTFLRVLAAVGWVLVVLSISGVGDGVVIEASTINEAEVTGTTPLLGNLIGCPFLTDSSGIFGENGIQFVLVNCAGRNGTLGLLGTCNSALGKVKSVEVGATPRPAPAMPLLPLDVTSDINPYSYGYYATYVAGIDFVNATGVAFEVHTNTSTGNNTDAIQGIVQATRGLVALTPTTTELPVALYVVDTTATSNPCSATNNLGATNVTFQFERSPGTTPYLMLNVADPGTDLCDVAATHAFKVGPEPTAFPTSGSSACASSNFGGETPAPRTFYPANFANVVGTSNPVTLLGTTVTAHTGLNFYPHLHVNGSIAKGTDLAAALGCINSTASRSAPYGSVRALVVRCGPLVVFSKYLPEYRAYQSALSAVRQLIGHEVKLLASIRVRPTPHDNNLAPSGQGQLVAAATYFGYVDGIVLRLDIAPTATAPAAVKRNFAGVVGISNAIANFFAHISSYDAKFNLILRFNASFCSAGGPLAPQGGGETQETVYTSCNVPGVNCLFTTYYAAAPAAATRCGFPSDSILSWEPFQGVATARTDGAETDPKNCNDSTVTPAYQDATIASLSTVDGPRLNFGAMGGIISPKVAATGPNAFCIFSTDGANASYGIVDCDSESDDFVNDCIAGYNTLRNASAGVALVARFVADIHDDHAFFALASTAGKLMNAAEWAGAHIHMVFVSGTSLADKLGMVTRFVTDMLAATSLPDGSDLALGIEIAEPDYCLPNGPLYTDNTTATLFAQLTRATSAGVSFTIYPQFTSGVATPDGLCGFPLDHVGYWVDANRTFGGDCSDGSPSYRLVSQSVAFAPHSPTRGGGGNDTALIVVSILAALFGVGFSGACIGICVLFVRRRRHRGQADYSTIGKFDGSDPHSFS